MRQEAGRDIGGQRKMGQHVTRLEHDAQQPSLAMVADGSANTNTRECTEGVATTVQVIRVDSFSARRVGPGPTTNSTIFGVKIEPPALLCRNDVVVESGDAAPKSCLPSLEMRSSTAADGLVPTGEISTATETTVNKPLLQFYSTEENDSKKENLWTLIISAWFDSSFWKLLVVPYCRRVVETKSRQNRTFDPGGLQGHLRACPLSKSWRALVCGKVIRAGAAGKDCTRFFWRIDDSRPESLQDSRKSKNLCRPYSPFSEEISRFSKTRPAYNTMCPEKVLPSRVARGSMSRRNGGHVVDEGARMSGAIDCWGMLWREEHLMASLMATPQSGVRSGAGTVFMANTPFLPLKASWYAELVVKPLYYCV